MYKVFYNDHSVFFIDSEENLLINENSILHYYVDKEHLKKTINSFLDNCNLNSLYILCPDVELVFTEYTKLYALIEAAGGLVKNANNKILFIYRRGKWDLPKGKIEKGEDPETAALREVEEECGIQNLKIRRHIKNTYHTYELKGEKILKRTYWYEMSHKGNEDLIPQLEEDITEAVWLGKDELDKVHKNTFQSITEILETT